ncbi:MAG: hypothetical protein H0T91_01280, partial [Propionibacteriaceae bacterium]|nr:hypothetical protein [Propionibacteriaceae bacterium]
MVSDKPGAVPRGEGEPTPEERASVRHELRRLKDFAQQISLDDVRQGAWFARLLKFSLDPYVHEVDAAYFTAKYPGLPADAVVQARIQLAARSASIEGAISAGAYTGAVAATIGTGGGSSPLTLPAAGVSFVLDLLFMSHLQLRLAYDIAMLYRVPLDLNDPEDLWKLIRVAFAIKAGETGRGAIGKGAPVLVRPIIKRIFSGSTLAAARSLPVVGRYLLQRNIIKFAIPAVGVPLSMAVNYWSTRVAGNQAVKVFREEARIAEAARRMTERTVHHAELLWVLWLIIKSDALIHENERLLLKHVTALVGDLDSELSAISGVSSTVDLDQKTLWAMLASATGDLEALYD